MRKKQTSLLRPGQKNSVRALGNRPLGKGRCFPKNRTLFFSGVIKFPQPNKRIKKPRSNALHGILQNG